MGLLKLPYELLFEIIEHLEYGWDLTAFGVVNRRLHGLVNTYIYHEKLPGCNNDVLEWIVEKGNEDVLAQCLKANILTYVDRPIASGTLQKAIILGRDRIFQRGRDRDGEIRIGQWSPRPLEWAAEAGHDSVVKILLEYGVDEKDGGPLVAALENVHLQVAKALLDKYLEV
ncbi:ankyrin [Penicillium subrubescens]|uniref:ankyrin n=1 Tax=Penicillium subrubescens TaxID=1316194 RepID=UPI0025452496|nr:ankyrin [Penicillium subrubescens]KAJ5883411.1 ankyrin [Penicillium subrubescens]